MLPSPNKLYGLVLCGGKSSRMNRDKAFLVYYDQPQCYYLYELLEELCSKVSISCNPDQTEKFEAGYSLLVDHTAYQDSGPIAAILSAYKEYPGKDLLVLGCDYPYLGLTEIRRFVERIPDKNAPAAFFNRMGDVYEPLLAWYPATVSQKVMDFYNSGGLSLQKFLKMNNAFKYSPKDKNQLISIDTPEEFAKVKQMINNVFNKINHINPANPG